MWSQGSATGLTTDVRYTSSTDAAATFPPPRTIAHEAGGLGNPIMACGRPRTVYVVYSAGRGAVGRATPDSPSTPTVVGSHNQGRSFGAPIRLGRSTDLLSFPGLRNGTGSALPALAAHLDSGLVCAAFIDHKAGASGAEVLLAHSRNGGHTWAPATRVTPPGKTIYFQPALAIDSAGRIGVMAFAMHQGMISVALMISEPRSVSFSAPITVTNQPFDPAEMNYQLGDNQALATTPGAFHPMWNQTHASQLQLFTTAIPVGG
jgi:hypothetical protein